MFHDASGHYRLHCYGSKSRAAFSYGRGPARGRQACATPCRIHDMDRLPLSGREDIDRLVSELNDLVRETDGPGEPTDTARLSTWLRLLTARGGSDLLLIAGAPASIRVDGRCLALDDDPLDGPEIEDAVIAALAPHARRQY